MTQKYYQDDVGTEVRVNTCVDLTLATTTNQLIRKTSGATATWVGTMDTETAAEVAARLVELPLSGSTPLDSIITYTTIAGDFDEAGQYKIQAKIVTPSGSWRGNTATFTVSPAWAL